MCDSWKRLLSRPQVQGGKQTVCQAPHSLFGTHRAGDINRSMGRKPCRYLHETTRTASGNNHELEPRSCGLCGCRLLYQSRRCSAVLGLARLGQRSANWTAIDRSELPSLPEDRAQRSGDALGEMGEGKPCVEGIQQAAHNTGESGDWGAQGCVDVAGRSSEAAELCAFPGSPSEYLGTRKNHGG